MIRKLTLAVGFGAGYVLGAKAGRQRYEEIVRKARELAGMPAVQEVTSNLSATASTLADTAKAKTNETITTVADAAAAAGSSAGGSSASETVDLTTGTTTSGTSASRTSTPGGTTPLTGATASDPV